MVICFVQYDFVLFGFIVFVNNIEVFWTSYIFKDPDMFNDAKLSKNLSLVYDKLLLLLLHLM